MRRMISREEVMSLIYQGKLKSKALDDKETLGLSDLDNFLVEKDIAPGQFFVKIHVQINNFGDDNTSIFIQSATDTYVLPAIFDMIISTDKSSYVSFSAPIYLSTEEGYMPLPIKTIAGIDPLDLDEFNMFGIYPFDVYVYKND